VTFGDSVDLWWPFPFDGDPNQRGSHFIEGIGRLKPGVTPEQAQAEINAIMTQLGREHSGDVGWTVHVARLSEQVVGSNRLMLLVLLGAVAMVLLIACANAANLQLVRAAARQREVAVRLALGAPRGRLIRQMLTESLLIALLGGALGALLAYGGVKALVSLLPAGFPRAAEIHVNAPVFAFTLMISAMTGILFGLAPAIQASRTDPKQGLYEGGRGATGSKRQQRLRSALVISEVSLACVLLIGAGLMLRSFLNQLQQNPGFEREHVLTASIALPDAKYKKYIDVVRFYDRLTTNLASAPGVQSAGAGSDLPWTGYDDNMSFTIEGKHPQPDEDFHARYHVATADYFRALGIQLVQGRFFAQSDDAQAPLALIVNQSMASHYWPGEDVLGRRITFESQPTDKDWYTVRQLDPTLALADVRLMEQIADEGVATPRFAFFLVGLFAGLAIVLAAIGTYGVISYSVSQRIPEFGLRLALGAPPSGLLRMVLAQAFQLAVAGTAFGVVVALLLSRLIRGLIYNVSPADPLTFAAVGPMVIAIALLACYLPARRATKANPMVALRAE